MAASVSPAKVAPKAEAKASTSDEDLFADNSLPTIDDDAWGDAEPDEGLEGEAGSGAPPGPPGFQRQKSWIVMGKVEIGQKQKDMIDDMSVVLNLDASKTAFLLSHYKWDTELVLREYTANPTKCLEKAGIKADEEKKEVKAPEEKTVDCPYCLLTHPLEETYALDCGHRFCLPCWKGWFGAAYDKGADCIFTNCPHYECKEIVSQDFFTRHITKDQRVRVEEWMTNAFVKLNARIKWCPRNGCDKAVEYGKTGMKTVTCECGYQFCFGCGNEAHEPAPCKAVVEWLKKDNSLILWLRENRKAKDVKNCTGCHEIIEKNQGCKHMTCRNCKHEFCWLCYQPWHGHNESLCNNYEQKDKEQELKESQGDSSAAGLRRYQFYFTRFENHQKSIKFAERIRADADKKMHKMQDMEGTSGSQVAFLLDAVNTVIDCRRLLQWSYPWSFLLDDGSSLKTHFKMHQDMLEELTEELSGMTEQPLAKLMATKQRTAIINHTRVILKFKQNIIDFAKANH
jgi:ariadne-1